MRDENLHKNNLDHRLVFIKDAYNAVLYKKCICCKIGLVSMLKKYMYISLYGIFSKLSITRLHIFL